MSPFRGKQIVQVDTRCNERERVGFIRASNSARLFLSFNVKYLSRAQSIAENA